MAKGQHLSSYQKGIVNRYYQQLDGIAITRLSESVSELYLTADKKKADKLWASVEKALEKTAAGDAAVKDILTTRNVAKLAELVGKLSK